MFIAFDRISIAELCGKSNVFQRGIYRNLNDELIILVNEICYFGVVVS